MKKDLIHIDQCGFLTTIQDNGRTNFLQYGVTKGGAMDLYSMYIANLLIGNEILAPVLEITQSPHQFQFKEDALLAFAGGGLQPVANGKELSLYQPIFLEKETTIELKNQIPGFRLYMSVGGGFGAASFLKSYSTDLLVKEGGFSGRTLKKGDTLFQHNSLTAFQKKLIQILNSGSQIQFKLNTHYIQQQKIRVIKGIEWDYLTDEAKQQLFTSSFTVTPQSSRMGIRLKGSDVAANQSCDIISSPVTQGTVQLTSSGELIVLMADAQTVGGYPRVVQVISADLPALAQKKQGDHFQFEPVSLQEAEQAYLQQAHHLQKLHQTIQQLNHENY